MRRTTGCAVLAALLLFSLFLLSLRSGASTSASAKGSAGNHKLRRRTRRSSLIRDAFADWDAVRLELAELRSNLTRADENLAQAIAQANARAELAESRARQAEDRLRRHFGDESASKASVAAAPLNTKRGRTTKRE